MAALTRTTAGGNGEKTAELPFLHTGFPNQKLKCSMQGFQREGEGCVPGTALQLTLLLILLKKGEVVAFTAGPEIQPPAGTESQV